MVRLTTGATLLALLCAAPAFAQPRPPIQAPQPPPPAPPEPAPVEQAPPAPAPTPAPPPPAAPTAPQDPYGQDVLNEQIAEELVGRAQQLLEARLFLDAKQLAAEAIAKSPKGNAADRARFIIKTVNAQLDIKEEGAAPPPAPKVDLSPIDSSQIDPSKNPPPSQQQPETPVHDGRNAAMIHGALYGGTLGATIGAFINQDSPATVAVPLGIATGVGAGLLSRRLVRSLKWDEAQVRTAGSFNLWGGVVGGLFAEAATGAGDNDPTAGGILLGASLGGALGLAGGGMLAKNKKLTRGDVALVDTLAGIGTVGGLTVGMLMQPAQVEAYSINAIIGALGGVVVGYIAAPQTNTTPRRMLRVAGIAAAGGALPFLIYAGIADSSTSSDERVVGGLSTLGLLAGAYLGFRLTRGMDEGLDVQDGKKSTDDAPAATLRRNSDGSWAFGGVGVSALSSQLSPQRRGEHGAMLTLLGGAF